MTKKIFQTSSMFALIGLSLFSFDAMSMYDPLEEYRQRLQKKTPTERLQAVRGSQGKQITDDTQASTQHDQIGHNSQKSRVFKARGL